MSRQYVGCKGPPEGHRYRFQLALATFYVSKARFYKCQTRSAPVPAFDYRD